jgi:oxygen-independent coproporphyrinogen-3 oxidase
MKNNAGLYIHIPFCVRKCAYCDFLSFEGSQRELMKRYTAALLNELRALRQSNFRIETVYIGGGTPTALPAPFLLEIVEAATAFDLADGAEFTVEANPGTLSYETLTELHKRGVNRLSIGLQAWQDELLNALGRIHTRAQFEENFHAARNAGFDNISVDLMFALPGQTCKQWEESLEALTALKPEHISAYSLTPEEGTPLWAQIESGVLTLPGDDTDREMYHAARRILSGAGYVHYELSNFALPGYEARHNSRYWTRSPYIGAGLGAHSFDGSARWHNTVDINKYINANEREDYQPINRREALAEEMMLGLRLMRGLKYNPFFSMETEILIERGLLKRHGDFISLTELGMDLANQVFIAFIE